MKNTKTGLEFDNSYLSLNSGMYTELDLNNRYKSSLELLNEELSKELGISTKFLRSEEGIGLLSGNPTQGITNAFAQAYSGHQFGYLNVLGDGRALILGEQITPSGDRFDIQLKGSGPTPYSRNGDGKATLYSMLREYLISEAMYAFNIPTTRALAVLKTNETVRRGFHEPGGIFTRVAKSHIRVGTFVYAYTNGGKGTLKELTDYTINRHYSHLNKETDKYVGFLQEVFKKHAKLVAKWQSFGFVHGVLNTDNVLISGETIDYGPCAFMNQYDPQTVFSSIDRDGRYAYENQPGITSWNLARFTETIMHLFDDNHEKTIEIANIELRNFEKLYNDSWLKQMSLKIGISDAVESDRLLIQELLNLMEAHSEDYTNTFRFLASGLYSSIDMYTKTEFKDWIKKWNERLSNGKVLLSDAQQIMQNNNPVIIPRNSIVEEALKTAAKLEDYTLLNELIDLLQNPFDYSKRINERFLKSESEEYTTYCGT